MTPLETELLEALEDVVNQACSAHDLDGGLHSGALSSYRDAIKLLKRLGRVEVLSEHGRTVTARWKERDNGARS